MASAAATDNAARDGHDEPTYETHHTWGLSELEDGTNGVIVESDPLALMFFWEHVDADVVHGGHA